MLVAPTLIVLAIVILYPVVNAIYMSFQQDEGLDPVTGSFVAGGFAGFANYVHWLFQQCETPAGAASCPPGTLGAQFWTATGVTFFFTVVTVFFETLLGFWMALIMARTFRGRSVLRAAVLVPWAIPTAVTAKLWFFIFAFDGIVNTLFQHRHPVDRQPGPGPGGHHHCRHLEDNAVHGAAHPGWAANDPRRGLRGGQG